jgi:NAD(P)-dependent dehydrogenase (short-subunit alcohol dehydrogenase family)
MDFMAHKQPLSGAMLEAGDIARAALFLLGEESRHITGQVLAVDGGWTVSG